MAVVHAWRKGDKFGVHFVYSSVPHETPIVVKQSRAQLFRYLDRKGMQRE